MTGRLIQQVAFQMRWTYVVAAAFLTQVWLLYSQLAPDVGEVRPPVISLIGATVLGPIFAMSTMGAREFRHLPLSRRDIVIATWTLATVVPAAVLLTTKMLAGFVVVLVGGVPRMPAEVIALSAVYDLAWTGAVLYMWLRVDAGPLAAPAAGRLAWAVGLALSLAVILGGLAAPILVRHAIPTRWDQMSWEVALVIATCLMLSVAALRWIPSRGVFAGDRPKPWWGPEARGERQSPRVFDRLPGLWRVAVPHFMLMLTPPLVVILGFIGYGLATGAGALWFVPASGPLADPDEGGLRLVAILPVVLVLMVGAWTPWVRLLKVLPVSVRQINALMVLTPFLTWASLWAIVGAAYTLSYGAPTEWRTGLFVGLAGVTALAHAVLLRFQGQFWIGPAMAVLLPRILEGQVFSSTHLVFGIAGGLTAIFAAGVNHSTLTHSTSGATAYARPQPPFGATGAPR